MPSKGRQSHGLTQRASALLGYKEQRPIANFLMSVAFECTNQDLLDPCDNIGRLLISALGEPKGRLFGFDGQKATSHSRANTLDENAANSIGRRAHCDGVHRLFLHPF